MITPPRFKRWRSPQTSKEGFALVISLTLMGFIMVLLFALTAFLTVETNSSGSRSSVLQAKQNARTAAMIALGELQMSMGADTRTSARAEILSSQNPDDPEDGVSPFNADEITRFWTGTWDTENWNPGDAEDRQGRFNRWLVSLPKEERNNVESVAENGLTFNPDNGGETAVVASLQAIPYNGTEPTITEVRVPLQDLDDRGAIAWWISDEGVKANISMVDSYRAERESNPVRDIPRYLFPHRNNLSGTEWFQNTDFNNADLISSLRKVTDTSASAELVFFDASVSTNAGSALAEDNLMADFSLYSYGVLSSNRRGGLRKDLSLALWRDPEQIFNFDPSIAMTNTAFENDFRRRRIFNYQDYPQADQSIRSPSAADKNFFAPRWQILRDYHNSFQRLADADNGAVRVVPLPDPGGSGNYYMPKVRLSTDTHSGFNDFRVATRDHLDYWAPSDVDAEILSRSDGPVEPVTSPVTPVLLRFNLLFHLSVDESRDSSGNLRTDPSGNQYYHPVMRVTPTVTLWNPYNVGISYEALDGFFEDFPVLNWDVEQKVKTVFTINGRDFALTRTGDFLSGGILTSSNERLWVEFDPASPELNDFAPGEIRVYTVQNVAAADDWNQGNPVALTSIFPDTLPANDPSDFPYLTLSETLSDPNNDLDELTEGDVLEIETRITSDAEGARPSFETHDFRIRLVRNFDDPSVDPGLDTSVTVNPDALVFLGGIELHLLPGSEFAEPDYSPSRFANFNVRPIYPKGGLMGVYDGQIPNYWFGFLPGPSDVNYEKAGVSTGSGTLMRGFWGASAGGSGGENFISLFDVPRRPPESLGQYQHAHLANLYPHNPTYPLGNSMADPHVRRAYAVDNFANRTFMDLSWFLNDALWDDYFLSTIDPYDIDNRSPGRLAPLRERFVELDRNKDYLYDRLPNPDNPSEAGYEDAAANLLLRGPFNVNSTSVEAWAAFLSGLGGEGISYLNQGSGSLATTSKLDHPFHRLSLPTANSNTPWRGGPLDFERAAIRTLAENMVEEVKKRGPFLSLSDFINRRLTDDERGLKGALQAAIDADPSTQGVVDNTQPAELSDAPVQNNIDGNLLDLAPGDLSQADILTTVGPGLSARSDTFIIRSYGRHTNPGSDKVVGEAWCEMLVQRLPDEPANETIGRPFRVVGFRYLNPDEI
ncbi:hypothetical protein DDZ13_11055 [Coraliomargarita sinensis]|uniref:Uncharacterized protein n=1 Tax=Coraliomargarita sinensis TaxID=2174842 RepID=A0A317ZDV4_9BACT|nr:hypothetical protein [Coraliomargarita sinensis]PXA03515.1 hypothetical protein DDZ13_11055 [Coraliomargarita sinensis]